MTVYVLCLPTDDPDLVAWIDVVCSTLELAQDASVSTTWRQVMLDGERRWVGDAGDVIVACLVDDLASPS